MIQIETTINYNIHNYVYGVRLSLLGDFNQLMLKNQLKYFKLIERL
jgi:hypothetical protein